MNFLENMKTSLVRAGGNMSIELQKRSPEICLGLGLVGFVGTVVIACRATLKAEEVLDRHERRMEQAREAANVADIEDDYDIGKEKTKVWAHTAVDFAKLYAPCTALGAISVGLLVKSHNILNDRYIGAVSAFNGVTEAFQAYRDRVIAEEGKEKDHHYRFGTQTETCEVTEVDENGNETVKEEVHEIMNDPIMPSDYARYFDESNPNWDENPMFNLRFLRAKETEANDILHSRGWISLNEVYDMTGYEGTPAGQVVGWVEGCGDGYVDFGLYDINDSDKRRFINGKESVVLLDFNVNGVILDKIDEAKKRKR